MSSVLKYTQIGAFGLGAFAVLSELDLEARLYTLTQVDERGIPRYPWDTRVRWRWAMLVDQF
jgi:hypothetical protein